MDANSIIGFHQDARRSFRRALVVDPGSAAAHTNLAKLSRDLGESRLALDSCRRALSTDREHAAAHDTFGVLHRDRGDVAATVKSYARSIALAPSGMNAIRNLGMALYDAHQFEPARRFLERSDVRGDAPRTLCCSYRLKDLSAFKRKLAALVRGPHVFPLVANLSAHHAINSGEPDPYDFCKRPLDFTYHAKLADDATSPALIERLLTIIRSAQLVERQQILLRQGAQSAGHLFDLRDPSIAQLKALIQDHVSAYYEKYKNKPCVLIDEFPSKTAFTGSWYVKMRQGGHLISHIHDDGWLSGVVYLSIPVKRDSGLEGSLHFSMDGDDYPTRHSDFPSLTLRVETGDIVLFPSSLFHRTVPFASEEERICIAFDLAPKEWVLAKAR